MSAPRLEAFKTAPVAPTLLRCTRERGWMDAFGNNHPYRCLPLTIANTHGWEVLVPAAFEVTWNGGPNPQDIAIRALEPFPAGLPLERFAISDFSRGIVTMNVGYLFRTPPGWNLLVTGPINEPRSGIQPLTAIVETDWLPFTFTMNWQMLDAGTVRFRKDEVYCAIMPIPKAYLEQWNVAIHELADDPVLMLEHRQFGDSRARFRDRQSQGDPETVKEGWQRHYMAGRFPDGTEGFDHNTRLRLNNPIDRTGTRPLMARDKSISPTVTAELENNTIRQWRRRSLLETMTHDSGVDAPADEATRQPTASSITIAPDFVTVPDAFDFVYQPAFLTRAECAMLLDTAETLFARDDHAAPAGIAARGVQARTFADILRHRSGTAAFVKDAQRRLLERLRVFYDLLVPIFAASVTLESRQPGLDATPDANPAAGDAPARDPPAGGFTSIVFLSDDHAGGELYFPRLDLLIRPTAGLALAFTNLPCHASRVMPVRDSAQTTMVGRYVFAPSQRDFFMYELEGSSGLGRS